MLYTARTDIGTFQQVDRDENLTGRVIRLKAGMMFSIVRSEHYHAAVPDTLVVTILLGAELYLVPAARLQNQIDPPRPGA